MNEPIISVSGLRGVVGESLTPDVATRYACAFASTLPPGPLVLTRDGRATGPMLAETICGALAAAGRIVINAGVAATPTLGVLVRESQAAGGIQISASHNPPEYNGLKLFSAAGRVIPADEGQSVLAAYRADEAQWVGHESIGCVQSAENTTLAHWKLIAPLVDVERIRARRFRVLLDANHGAGSLLGRYLLRELGCEAFVLGDTPDGQFAHPPEPTADNLQSVLSRVKDFGANIGFCQDPDADRLAVIDEGGRYLGEEYTLALCVDHVLRSRPGPVVTNCSTSRMSEDLAGKYGAPFFRSQVGEANVVDIMLAHNAVVGGEGNGGVIDPRVVLVRDSFVAMALILDAMAARQLSVSNLAGELPNYEIHKAKVPLANERLSAALAAVEKHFSSASPDRMDGLRLDWPDRWLLVRASNTEPIVRIIAEAPSREDARRLCEDAGGVIAQD